MLVTPINKQTQLPGEKKSPKNQLQKHKKRRPANNSSGFEYVKFSTFNDVTDSMSQFDLSS